MSLSNNICYHFLVWGTASETFAEAWRSFVLSRSRGFQTETVQNQPKLFKWSKMICYHFLVWSTPTKWNFCTWRDAHSFREISAQRMKLYILCWTIYRSFHHPADISNQQRIIWKSVDIPLHCGSLPEFKSCELLLFDLVFVWALTWLVFCCCFVGICVSCGLVGFLLLLRWYLCELWLDWHLTPRFIVTVSAVHIAQCTYLPDDQINCIMVLINSSSVDPSVKVDYIQLKRLKRVTRSIYAYNDVSL